MPHEHQKRLWGEREREWEREEGEGRKMDQKSQWSVSDLASTAGVRGRADGAQISGLEHGMFQSGIGAEQ